MVGETRYCANLHIRRIKYFLYEWESEALDILRNHTRKCED